MTILGKNLFIQVGYTKSIHRPNQTWFKVTPNENIAEFYNLRESPTFVFFKRGHHIDDKPIIWNSFSDEPIFHWVWSMVACTVKVVNQMNTIIRIQTHGYGIYHETQIFELLPNEEITIVTYQSFYVTATKVEGGEFLDGWILKNEHQTIIVNKMKFRDLTERQWLEAADDDEIENEKTVMKQNWVQAIRELKNLKQPQLVPQYTAKGYDIRRIPTDIWESLKAFWRQNKDVRTAEYWTSDTVQINQKEIRCTYLNLTGGMENAIVWEQLIFL